MFISQWRVAADAAGWFGKKPEQFAYNITGEGSSTCLTTKVRHELFSLPEGRKKGMRTSTAGEKRALLSRTTDKESSRSGRIQRAACLEDVIGFKEEKNIMISTGV